MTTKQQNQWAVYLETATPKEVRQMAEYAIDHIDDVTQLRLLAAYLVLAISSLDGLELE